MPSPIRPEQTDCVLTDEIGRFRESIFPLPRDEGFSRVNSSQTAEGKGRRRQNQGNE